MRLTLRRTIPKALLCLGAFLSGVVAIASYRYLMQLGPVPPNVAANRFLHPWIVIHATSAASALLVGVGQLLPAIRERRASLHRWAGRVYVIACLVGGISGLVLALGVSTGPIAATGFAILAILWIFVTTRGWLAARRRSWLEHRRWMVRSYALTFAAVTLRLYLPVAVIASMHGFDFIGAYRLIAWLAWVPNAILAELYLKRRRTVFLATSKMPV